ncbi:MAG: hypothetical protein A2X86_11385 [Bdellovibrionales bacterium GWA2_49_15]|nr:MAG: hypothetical protein A2X86_11385 [Bdellovibrionales bacterium GWA2_49_15]HAZ12647.1 hypothetical protein [Bdellovibrionales bacterium]
MSILRTKHIIFDFDGTVVDSYHAVLLGVQTVLSELLNRPILLDELKKNYSPHLPELLQNFNIPQSDLALTKRLARRWSELALEMEFDYVLFPGILESFVQLRQLGATIYLWTARDRASTVKILENFNLKNHFTDFRCGDDTATKPSPDGISAMVGHISKDDVVVIGDSHMDILGAKNFGCRSIAALWCQGADRETVLRHSPDFFANTPLECLEIIRGMYV